MSEKQLPEIKTAHVLEHFKNHCRFLGYAIEEDSDTALVCMHPRKYNFSLLHLANSAGVYAQMLHRLPYHVLFNLPLLFRYANDLNQEFTFLKAFIFHGHEQYLPMLHLSSVYEGEYNQKTFSIFMDNLEYDLLIFKNHPKTIEFWYPRKS